MILSLLSFPSTPSALYTARACVRMCGGEGGGGGAQRLSGDAGWYFRVCVLVRLFQEGILRAWMGGFVVHQVFFWGGGFKNLRQVRSPLGCP